MQQHTRSVRGAQASPVRPVQDERARSVLRSATADLHFRAEEALGPAACEVLPRYIAMLQANLAVTDAVRRATGPLLASDVGEGLADDAHRLGRDLAWLGAGPDAADAHLELDGPAGALGAVYVLEGARLGGRVLARRAESRLGLTAEHGAAYLNGDGAAAGARWRRFLGLLEERLLSPRDLSEAVAAARQTFLLVIHRYERGRA